MLPGYRMYRPLNSLPEVINTLKNDFFLTSLLLEILFRKVKDVLNGVQIGLLGGMYTCSEPSFSQAFVAEALC